MIKTVTAWLSACCLAWGGSSGSRFDQDTAVAQQAGFQSDVSQSQRSSGASMPTVAALDPLIDEHFDTPWPNNRSANGLWRINGPWVGTGGNQLDPSLSHIDSGVLSLTVKANELRGSEVQTVGGFGYGYYETKLKVTSTSGVVNSFFWVEAPGYGPREWDVEFTTNEPWVKSKNFGKVHLTLHPSGQSSIIDLPFNPSADFHRYGFLWTPGTIAFTVDGETVKTFSDPQADTSAKGFIMMNAWTGNRDFGGGPPNQDATSDYKYVRFFPDLSLARASAQSAKSAENLDSTESLFAAEVPAKLAVSDGPGSDYELGLKFKATTPGHISAIRFYKSPSESGVHTGKIYSSSGVLLANARSENETKSGWQTARLETPLTISPMTEYVVSVNTGNGHYAATTDGLSSQNTSAHQMAVAGGNGVYGPVGSMPTRSWNNSNYFRDVVFTPDASVSDPAPSAPR